MSGNAAEPAVLIQAHIAEAAMLVVAPSDTLIVRQMADTARKLNPSIEIVLRTHSEDGSQLLRKEGIGTVFFGEEELARGMTGTFYKDLRLETELTRERGLDCVRPSARRHICTGLTAKSLLTFPIIMHWCDNNVSARMKSNMRRSDL
ncbi:unnamed protein product [Candidatus Paraburkholderia kirkii UZHbot1]|uniref:WGS project CAFE00000000 data, contig bkir_c30 n=1 Tax=Candidatus Paraburkholderia kirkii UZHbot1 TaxID=1055526 RepID=U3UAT9_9BURK|nr:unnamed protein product [Candidatus Paraburkholderia kirkii UZHbot1]